VNTRAIIWPILNRSDQSKAKITDLPAFKEEDKKHQSQISGPGLIPDQHTQNAPYGLTNPKFDERFRMISMHFPHPPKYQIPQVIVNAVSDSQQQSTEQSVG